MNDCAVSNTIVHRCRPNNSLPTLEAENSNRIRKSVSDGLYLRQKERRILLPMLAKQYEKESHKITDDEIIYVSPKLDGVRCIAAYNANNDKVLFFSRSGTLFECCDAKIEPALQQLFHNDPTLVLDGELYNDSVNLQLIAKLATRTHSPLLEMLMVSYALMPDYADSRDRCKRNNNRKHGKNNKVKKTKNANVVGANVIEANSISETNLTRSYCKANSSWSLKQLLQPSSTEIIKFEQLMSAIRTTRDKRTPEIAALQRQLQYHVFDVLYAKPFDKTGSPPYAVRYEFLSKLIANLHHHNLKVWPTRSVAAMWTSKLERETPSSEPFCEAADMKEFLYNSSEGNEEYDINTIKLVPSLPCMKHEINAALRAAMKVGYEGVMVRRNCLHGEPVQRKKGIIVTSTAQVNPQNTKKTRHAHTHKQTAHTEESDNIITSAATSDNMSDATAGYAYGQRSATLLKYKLMQDDEFTIVSAIEGKGKWKGQLGAFLCQTKDKKHTFTVAPASSDREKQEM